MTGNSVKTKARKGFLVLFLCWIMTVALIMVVSAETNGNGSTGTNGFSWSWVTDNQNAGANGDGTEGRLSGTILSFDIYAGSSTYIPEEKNSCNQVTQEKVDAAATTVTATITNNTGSTIRIQSISIENDKALVNNLATGGMLEDGKSFDILLTAIPESAEATESKVEKDTVTIEYTVVEAINVTFSGAENVSYTYNGVTLSASTDSTQVPVLPGSTITFPTPSVSSGTFYGWRMDDGSLHEAGSTVGVSSDTIVYPVILSGNEKAIFLVGDNAYYFWEDAMYAASAVNSTVILSADYTLPTSLSENGVSYAGGRYVSTDLGYIVPKGVTLLIPFDSTNTLVTNDGDNHLVHAYDDKTNETRKEYRRLTMPTGISITVQSGGAISIASQVANQFIGQVGPYGAIYMEEGSNITVNTGGALYAWGYIFYGDTVGGTVTINSGGTVYEPMSIMDYPGSASLTNGILNNDAFPMRAYTVRNVEVPMTLKAGSSEQVFYCLYGDRINTHPKFIQFIGNQSTAAFQTASDTAVSKSYSDGIQYMESDGDITLNPLSVTIATTLATKTISTEDTTGFYIPSGYDITLKKGTLKLNDNVIMAEGSKLTVAQNATINTNGKNLYVLDDADDGGSVSTSNGCSIYVQDVHGNYYSTVAKDAILDVNGTIIASGGFYTSTNGAAITSTEETGKIELTGTSPNTSVYIKQGNSSAQNVTITSAQLKNADNTHPYTATAQSTTTPNTYTYTNGRWICTTHTWSGNTCTVCGVSAVAQIGGEKYHTLAAAVEAYSGTDYIQMLTGTTETTIGDANNKKDIYLDLNGQDVKVTTFNVGTLYGMDTATNGFTSNTADVYGEIIGTVNGNVAEYYQYDMNNVSGKYYVASTEGNLSFHRFDMGVTDYTFYGSKNSGSIVFNMVFKGDALAKAEILKQGVYLNSDYNWSDSNSDTLTGGLDEITGDGFTTPFTVKAAVMLCDTNNEDLSDNPVFAGDNYFANGISFQSAMKSVYSNLSDATKKTAFENFASANGFSLSN